VPVAVVVEEQVGLPRQAARSALHRDAAVFAGLVAAELGQVREIDLHVAADEQIEPAVAIVVCEAAAGRPAAGSDASLLRDVGERAVAVVAIQVVAADGGDVEILTAVAIHVRRADAHAPARVADACAIRHVLELPVSEIAIERAASRVWIVGGGHGQRIDEVDVRQPVVVDVHERHAALIGFDDEFLLRCGVMREGDAGLARDVAEQHLGGRPLRQQSRG
jgi:lactate dehydrogenase-like 2-hydroxyacid dehydrogenase